MTALRDKLHPEEVGRDNVFEEDEAVNISEAARCVLERLNIRPISQEEKVKFAEEEARKQAEALTYLRSKFPDVDEKIFFTDSSGKVWSHVECAFHICLAEQIERACLECDGQKYLLPEGFRDRKRGKPIVSIEDNLEGSQCICVRWTREITCRYDQM